MLRISQNLFGRTKFRLILVLILSELRKELPPHPVPEDQKKPGLNRVKIHQYYFLYQLIEKNMHKHQYVAPESCRSKF